MAKVTADGLLKPEVLTMLEGRARDGMTDQELAQSLGISRRLLSRWMEEHPELAAAVRRGREAADYLVENALLQTALNGNTTAQLFWLRNRRPDKWRDKPEQKTGPGGGVVLLTPVMEDPGPPRND